MVLFEVPIYSKEDLWRAPVHKACSTNYKSELAKLNGMELFERIKGP